MIDKIKHINWSDFHFLRTEYLWIAIPVIVVLIMGLIFQGESIRWKNKIAKHIQPYVIKKGTEWKSKLMHLSVIIMFTIGLTSIFGPTWEQIELPSKKVKSKFVIALDLSQSMMATDISPTRLERAKFKINDLLTANPKAETSLVVFSGSTHTAIPFTTDYKIIIDQIDGLKPSMMPVKGTNFNLLFNKIDTLFKYNIAEGKVLLITDDLLDLSIERVNRFVQENNTHLYIYTFASQSGAIIPRTKFHSNLDVDKLNALGAIDKIDILEITLDNSDVVDLSKAIGDNIVFEDISDEKDENWQDYGYWLTIPLAFIFLFSFRKGWSLNLIILAFIFSSCSNENKIKQTKFKDLWYTQEYQAQQNYDEENYLEAAQGFKDPMRKGISYYKAGDFISAQTAFEKDTTTNGMYNLALTYAKLGDLEKSKETFERVLEKDPSNKNAISNLNHIENAISEIDKLSPQDVGNNEGKKAKNTQNDSQEDLSGGGQEATKKDMEKERQEETVDTGKRKAKELEEVPEDFKSGKGEIPKNILMRKVDDDPALFLTKKFRYQVKKNLVEVEKPINKW